MRLQVEKTTAIAGSKWLPGPPLVDGGMWCGAASSRGNAREAGMAAGSNSVSTISLFPQDLEERRKGGESWKAVRTRD